MHALFSIPTSVIPTRAVPTSLIPTPKRIYASQRKGREGEGGKGEGEGEKEAGWIRGVKGKGRIRDWKGKEKEEIRRVRGKRKKGIGRGNGRRGRKGRRRRICIPHNFSALITVLYPAMAAPYNL